MADLALAKKGLETEAPAIPPPLPPPRAQVHPALAVPPHCPRRLGFGNGRGVCRALARRKGIPPGRFREPPSWWQDRQAPDARREPDANRDAVPHRSRRYVHARRDLRDVAQRPRDDLRG